MKQQKNLDSRSSLQSNCSLERIKSGSYDTTINESTSLLTSFRHLPKRKSNEKVMDTVNYQIASSQAEATGRKRTLYSRDFNNFGTNDLITKNTLSTSTIGNNKSDSDIELDIEMSRIHSSFQQSEKAVLSEQEKFPVKKEVAANKPESRVVMRSNWKAGELDEQSDFSEEESEAEVIVTNKKTPKQKTQENEEIHLEPNTNGKEKNSHKQQEFYTIRNKINYRKVSTESDSLQEQEPVTNIVKENNSNQQNAREAEVNRLENSTHSDQSLNMSDSSQEQESVVSFLNTKKSLTNKKSVMIQNNITAGSDSVNKDLVGQNEHQSKVGKPTLRNRELEGLKIRYDRELMSEFDEGIALNDSNNHSNDHSIYPNVYRVADCERKLRVRRSYSRSYEMYDDQFDTLDSSIDPTEELQTKKRKKSIKRKIQQNMPKNCSANKSESSSVQQMPTIHEISPTITEEALSYANLIKRFQDYGQNSTMNTSEASTSTRVHSNNLDVAQMEDLNFTECGDGVLFGKYVDASICGVIQFLEGKKKDFTKSKRSDIKLFLISGELEVTVATKIHILKPMGFMIIHCCTEYKMRNSYKGVSIVLFTREDNRVNKTSSSRNSTTEK